MSDHHKVRTEVLEHGHFLKRGSEAELYVYQGSAWKVYFTPIVEERFQRNVQFLMKYSHTNVVPKFQGVAILKSGIIRMQFLDESFLTLKEIMAMQLSIDVRRALLSQLLRARRELPMYIQFCDFKNPENIMVKTVKGEHFETLGVIFIEGGTEQMQPNAAYLFLELMAEFLKLSKDATFKEMKSKIIK